MDEEKEEIEGSGELNMEQIDENLNRISLEPEENIDLNRYAYRDDVTGPGDAGQLTLVPVRNPLSQSWIYISPQREWHIRLPLIHLKESREYYLVAPEVRASLDGEVVGRTLVPYADREGAFFLWPLRLADYRGNLDSWSRSAWVVVMENAGQWIRVKAKYSASAYEVFQAPAKLPPPEWPEGGIQYLINKAFKKKTIYSLEDPVIKKLRGYL